MTSAHNFASMSPSHAMGLEAAPQSTASSFATTTAIPAPTLSTENADSFKKRLQQLREEAAMDSDNHQKIVRRASNVCGDLKSIAHACTSNIDLIVEKQKVFFRNLSEEDLEAAIDKKYKECNKCKRGMTRKEFALAMAFLGKVFSDEEVQECFTATDADNDKYVSPEEYNTWVRTFVGAPPRPPIPEPVDVPAKPLPPGHRLSMRRASAAVIAANLTTSPSSASSGRRRSIPLPKLDSVRASRVSSLNDTSTRSVRSPSSAIADTKSVLSPSNGSSKPEANVTSVKRPSNNPADILPRTPSAGTSPGGELKRTASSSSTASGASGGAASVSNVVLSRRSSQPAAAGNVSRAAELLAQLEKRKALAATYGRILARIPGHRTRATTADEKISRTGSSASNASNVSGTSTVVKGNTFEEEASALAPIESAHELSPTDVAERSTELWQRGQSSSWSTLSGGLSVKTSTDSLRGHDEGAALHDEGAALTEDALPHAQASSNPMARLREAVQSVNRVLCQSNLLTSSFVKHLKARVPRLPPFSPVRKTRASPIQGTPAPSSPESGQMSPLRAAVTSPLRAIRAAFQGSRSPLRREEDCQ